MYTGESGVEVLGSGSNPSTETVPVKRIFFPVQLHDGVVSHAAARRLDQAGYRYERSLSCDINGLPIHGSASQLSVTCPVPSASAGATPFVVPLKSSDGESFVVKS